ncbi:hypothetical protein BLNAU_6237 [Blattamonas nauphoetae]|uniref:Uncharacterized protein n=1 Tax=Blattamonas nauphoetae TaxID=2049346 RepID=A0ABQ9Y4Y1_9EUKA|nr:hypothetical protein BLNAU_6237 [Blattamonas nauphoetae]
MNSVRFYVILSTKLDNVNHFMKRDTANTERDVGIFMLRLLFLNQKRAVQRPSKKFVGLSFTDSQKDAKEVLTSDYIVKRTVPDAGDGADEALSPDE